MSTLPPDPTACLPECVVYKSNADSLSIIYTMLCLYTKNRCPVQMTTPWSTYFWPKVVLEEKHVYTSKHFKMLFTCCAEDYKEESVLLIQQNKLLGSFWGTRRPYKYISSPVLTVVLTTSSLSDQRSSGHCFPLIFSSVISSDVAWFRFLPFFAVLFEDPCMQYM